MSKLNYDYKLLFCSNILYHINGISILSIIPKYCHPLNYEFLFPDRKIFSYPILASSRRQEN